MSTAQAKADLGKIQDELRQAIENLNQASMLISFLLDRQFALDMGGGMINYSPGIEGVGVGGRRTPPCGRTPPLGPLEPRAFPLS